MDKKIYNDYEAEIEKLNKENIDFYLRISLQTVAAIGCQAFNMHPIETEEAIKEGLGEFFTDGAKSIIIEYCKALSRDERGYLTYISRLPKNFFKLD